MAKTQTAIRQAAGLYLHPNQVGAPEGAMWMARNAVIDREGAVGKRRGMDRYGDALNNVPSGLYEYDGTLIVKDSTSLKYDSDGAGTWAAWPGSYSPPDSDTDMQALEANKNFYFLTSLGPYVNDSTTGTPTRSGVPQGLDVQLTKTGTGGSWLTGDVQVGYRVCWVKEDANENEKRSAPSFRQTITNSKYTSTAWSRAATTATFTLSTHGYSVSDTIEIEDTSSAAAIPNGFYTIQSVPDANSFTITCLNAGDAAGTATVYKKFDVAIVSTIPDELAAGDTYEVYRTEQSAAADTDPGDRHYLISEGALSSTDITNGYISLTDDKDEDFLGSAQSLYTNDLDEGLAQKNDRPPYAKYVATFEGHTFYANTRHEHEYEIQLNTITGLVDDTSSITITDGSTSETYTFSTAEDGTSKKFKRYTSGAAAANVRQTMQSFCKIVNRESAYLYAHYSSGIYDPPGKVILRRRTLVDTSFAITANNSTCGSKFTPVLPTSGSTVSSSADARENGIVRTKYHQPEAAPRLNLDNIGRRDKAIIGMAAIREALLVFKEDGTYAISGESDGGGGFLFRTDELDPTIRVTAPNTIAVLDNAVYAYTDQGVVKITAAGAGVVSRPMEVEFRKRAAFTNFDDYTRAWAYESDRAYFICMPNAASDTRAQTAFRYNYITQTWTDWDVDYSNGLVKSSDDKLYTLHNVDKYVYQERKEFSTRGADYKDAGVAGTVTASGTTTYNGETVSTATVTFSFYDNPALGWLFEQGSNSANIVAVVDNGGGSYTFTLNDQFSISNAACTLYQGYKFEVEWAPITSRDLGILKKFSACMIYPESDESTETRLGFKSDMQDDWEYTDRLIITRTRGWGASPWGSTGWGSSSPGAITGLRTFIPRNHQLGRSLGVRVENRFAGDPLTILQVSVVLYSLSNRTERL